jgi:hypothetical protein
VHLPAEPPEKKTTLRSRSSAVAQSPGGRPVVSWRLIGTGAGVLGGEGATMYLHPALGAALAVMDITVPVLITLILLVAILTGSDKTCERVFRLLRWVANRPEPPGPSAERA